MNRDGVVVGHLSRKIFDDDSGDKYYWNCPVRPSEVKCMSVDKDNPTRIIIVEDHLSFLKVSEAKVGGVICVFGTEMTEGTLNLIKHNDEFLIWFDNDNSTVKQKQAKLKKRLEVFGKAVIIKTSKDPKKHTIEEIKDIVSSHSQLEEIKDASS
jgi:DNA primase